MKLHQAAWFDALHRAGKYIVKRANLSTALRDIVAVVHWYSWMFH
jgi:hypothetical protein